MWTSENMLELVMIYILPCVWDVQSAEHENRNKKADACDTLATKYGVSEVEVKKKIGVENAVSQGIQIGGFQEKSEFSEEGC
jgi:hypothetical protein